ncbi:MAG: hypothetical protein V2B19_02995, partial [Pseudomonadota bacterium]
DHRFGQFPTAGRPRQGVFGRAAGCLSDSEFLPVWKKYPGVAGTMIKAADSIDLNMMFHAVFYKKKQTLAN